MMKQRRLMQKKIARKSRRAFYRMLREAGASETVIEAVKKARKSGDLEFLYTPFDGEA
jgi:hypothetical protein